VPVTSAIEDLFQNERRSILATLIRACGGDFQLAEDALQEAFQQALHTWPRDGIPPNPSAWITTSARRKAIDQLRRSQNLLRKQQALSPDERVAAGWGGEPASGSPLGTARLTNYNPESVLEPVLDDELRLLFTCCHPALSLEAQVGLTLKVVVGLSTEEIARAFLMAGPALAQRIVRAKRKIKRAGIPYQVPEERDLPVRLDAVLAVVYLIFNEGYSSTKSDTLIRSDLCREAIRLGKLVTELVPRNAESKGLYALMLLHDSRRLARTGKAGELITLEDQDRSLWQRNQIAIGCAVLDKALLLRAPGPYQIQAAIAALHARSERPEDTDWSGIAQLYGALARWRPSPVVDLNRAVAIAMAEGPEAGLDILDAIQSAGELKGYHLLPAARADLLRRMNQNQDAAAAYLDAIRLCSNPVERAYLEQRLSEVGG